MNLSGWYLILEGPPPRRQTWRIPESDFEIRSADTRFVAAKTTGCFPEPDWVIPDLNLPLRRPLPHHPEATATSGSSSRRAARTCRASTRAATTA